MALVKMLFGCFSVFPKYLTAKGGYNRTKKRNVAGGGRGLFLEFVAERNSNFKIRRAGYKSTFFYKNINFC